MYMVMIKVDHFSSISLLDKFKDSFVTGFLRIRVNAGRLEIRLIDPNTTVGESPYRLSEEEERGTWENKRFN